MSAITSGADKDNKKGEGTPAVAMSRWCTRVQTYTSICIYYVFLYSMHMKFCVNAYITTPDCTSNPYKYERIHTCICVHTST